MTIARRLAPLLVLLVVAGCATQADIQDVAREQRRLRSQLADTRASVEEMQRDIAQVRGGVDEVRHTSRRDVAGRLKELETRVEALEGARLTGLPSEAGAVPYAMPSPTPAGIEGGVAIGALSREEAGDAPQEYRRGLALVREGAYDRAIQSFRDFLRTNRDSPLAPNAHYWVGESYYMLGDYYQAILNFNDVRQQYAKSDRAPAAVLKIGLAFLQMGNKSEARLAFQKVLNDYPSAPEAAQAREKLRALGA